MVKVKSTNSIQKINVSSLNSETKVSAVNTLSKYYSDLANQSAVEAKDWASKLGSTVDGVEHSAKHYAEKAKESAASVKNVSQEISTTAQNALLNISEAKNISISNIQEQESVSIENVTSAGVSQISNINTAGANQVNLATEQANIATQQATIATNKTNEVSTIAENALSNIETAKSSATNAIENKQATAITNIANQETTSKNSIIETGATQIGLIQQEAQAQISNIEQTGFYMEDGKLYYDVNGEKKEFKSDAAGFSLFDFVLKDHILSFEETQGYALQGTYVYKDGVAGERYGYPDFYNKCVEEKNVGVVTQTTLGGSTITTYNHANGHIYYDIADKGVVDNFFNANGVAWFYGVDTANERIFLPRNEWFVQATGDVSKVNNFNDAGLPNHKHYEFASAINGTSGDTLSKQYLKPTEQVNSAGATGWVGYNLATTASSADVGLSSYAIGDIYGNSTTVQPKSSNKLLYIVVGNTSEVTHLTTTISEGDVLSQINKNKSDITDIKDEKIGRQDCKAYITETYVNGTSWYRVWSDGWCEQGGVFGSINTDGIITINLLKSYKDINYNAVANDRNTTTINSNAGSNFAVKPINGNSMTVYNNGMSATNINWLTLGYIN